MFALSTLVVLTLLATDGTSRERLATTTPAVAVAPASVAAPASDGVGAVAPDFTLQDADGRTVRLSDFRGKAVVIEFWATWCGPCQRALPAVSETAKKAGSDVIFLAINVDDRETGDQVRRFLLSRKLEVRALVKGSATGRRYGVGPIPHTVVIGRDGKVASRHIGISSEAALQEAVGRGLDKALAQR